MNELRSFLDFDLPPLQLEAGSGGAGASPAQIAAWLNSASADPLAS